MLSLRLSDPARCAIFAIVAATAGAGGLILHGLSLAAVHFAVLPVFIGYALTLQAGPARLRLYHVLYVLFLAAMVATYLVLLARAIPDLRICWVELPIAVWFLLTMHVVVRWMDRIVDWALSAAFGRIGLKPNATSPRRLYLPKVFLRGLCVLAVATPYILALFAVHWVKFLDNNDPMRQGQTAFEHVRLQAADGVDLDGWFIPGTVMPGPRVLVPDATVIVVPGRGMPKGCSLNYAQILYLNGYNVLLFDLRGEGGSAGHSRSFGIREAQDVLGAVQYLEQTHAESSRHIYALGVSQGASAVIRAAAMDERVRAVVVDSTLTVANDVLPARVLLRLPAPLRGYVGSMTRLFASAELGCNLFRHSDLAAAAARLSPRPLLVIHGSADTMGDPNEAARLYAAAGEPKCLDMVPGAGHAQSLLVEGPPYVLRILQLLALARKLDLPS
jgi:alpha-beta hydrolase superfamily lysophospholipase